jgi:hypothetical protein
MVKGRRFTTCAERLSHMTNSHSKPKWVESTGPFADTLSFSAVLSKYASYLQARLESLVSHFCRPYRHQLQFHHTRNEPSVNYHGLLVVFLFTPLIIVFLSCPAILVLYFNCIVVISFRPSSVPMVDCLLRNAFPFCQQKCKSSGERLNGA